MKKLVIIIASLLITQCTQAAKHTLKELVPALDMVVKSAKQSSDLPDIVHKYHKQALQKNYDITFKEFVQLYQEICALQGKRMKNMI